MAGTIGTGRPGHVPRLNLNSTVDRTPCSTWPASAPSSSAWSSFALGMFLRYVTGTGTPSRIAAAVTGLAALLVGLFTQMMSATREERILLVTGMIAGFVGLALGLAHGGFSG